MTTSVDADPAQGSASRPQAPDEAMAPWPSFAPDERAAVDAVLASGKVNYWTGQETREFEREFGGRIGSKHSIALANGTVALELPLRMWGVGPGDDVIVTPRSFIASVSCAVLLGARPVFADVDRDSGNITADSIERVLTPRTKAVIPVHLAGWPCDLDPIMDLAEARGLRVLEDCAQSHGATYRGKVTGSIGHAAGFSFCQDKIMTTAGEGGLLTTDDDELWDRAWSYKDHGKTWDAVYNREHPAGFRWVHERFGTNLRMTEIQSAVGRAQLRKLDGWLAARRRNADIYSRRLAELPALRIPAVPQGFGHARYKFYAYVRPEALASNWSRERILATLAERRVTCFSGSCSEVYRERAFDGTGFAPDAALPIARELGETSLMFLVHPTLSEDWVHRTCDIVGDVLREATR